MRRGGYGHSPLRFLRGFVCLQPHYDQTMLKYGSILVTRIRAVVKIPPDAVIPEDKLTRYLLVPRPRNDKSRFLARAGFTQENPDALEAAIRQLIRSEEAIQDRSTDYGDFYRVEGDLVGPQGRLVVVTVWMIQTHVDNRFRFVTLRPGRKSEDET